MKCKQFCPGFELSLLSTMITIRPQEPPLFYMLFIWLKKVGYISVHLFSINFSFSILTINTNHLHTFIWSLVFFFLFFKKKVDRNYTRMLHTLLNKSWKQHPTKQPFVSHLKKHLSKTNKTYWALQEKQAWSHKEASSMGSYRWKHLYWLTCKDLYLSAPCRY